MKVTFACVQCTAIKEDVPTKPGASPELPVTADLPEGWGYGRFWWQIPASGVVREVYLPVCASCKTKGVNGEKFSATAKVEVERLREGA